MNFASNLQKLRKLSSMSQEALAEKLDVTRQSVSKWESGASYPEMDKLIAICKIFKVDMDTLVNGDVSKVTKESDDNTIKPKEVLSKFDIFMKKIITLFDNMTFKELIGFFVTIFVLIIIICICRLPVDFLEHIIGDNLLYHIGAGIGPVLAKIFSVIIDIIYAVLSVCIFLYALKIKYLDGIVIKNSESEIKIKEEKDIPLKEEKKEETVIIKEPVKEHSFISFLTKIIIFIIKFFLLFVLLGVIFCLVFLAITFGFLVLFVFNGFPVIGILLGTLAALIICSICFLLPLNFILNHKTSYKKVIISLGGAFGIFLLGCIFFAFEFFSLTFIDALPDDIKLETKTSTYQMTDDFRVNSIYGNTTYEADEFLTDQVVVEISYYDYFYDFDIVSKLTDNNMLVIYKEENTPKEIDLKELLGLVKDNLRDGNIYNYNDLEKITVTITTSSENLEKIFKNNTYYGI